ncbi:chromate efflux transporter [Desulfovibrio aminophilus]|nr:chromate efflux transporter [Desulfovibrio aminophilus]MCM0754027.1 chromate efflux transporter [Desulfovibrio aminophilus]
MNKPTFSEALRVWLRIGLTSFGGPAGQIAMMNRMLVEERRWISEERFLHALNYCTLLPGPEAQQLATYIGWLLHGTRGGVAAGVLFVLPGFLVILLLSALYVTLGRVPAVQGLFWGLKAAVLAIVVEAVLRLGRKSLKHPLRWTLAGASFAALFFLGVPFPWVILVAGLTGLLGSRLHPAAFAPGARMQGSGGAVDEILESGGGHLEASGRRAAGVLATWLPVWLGPVLALGLWLGWTDTYTRIGVFFSKMAVVTFGGAYAVLAYVAQQAVENYHWLTSAEMLHGLALAETTPGPLILVLQYVAFVAASRDPGLLNPLLAGTLGAALAVHVTFAPCFLWILLGAPYIERLRTNRALAGALAAINAAVVGVVMNLAVWFSLHALFTTMSEVRLGPLAIPVPAFPSIDVGLLVLGSGAMFAMLRFRAGMVPVLTACGGLGVAYQMIL